MAAQSAEAQARILASLREIVSFFETASVQQHSIDNMNEFLSKNQYLDFLNLVESYGECMAFLDHDELCSKLLNSYNLLYDGYTVERKIVKKRLRFLAEDKKSDPEVVLKNENHLFEVEQKRAQVLIHLLRMRTMVSIPIQKFKENGKFDAMSHYREEKKHRKELLQAGKS